MTDVIPSLGAASGPRRCGPYLLDTVLGSGGQGTAWRGVRAVPVGGAIQEVCIKVFEDGLVNDPQLKKAFQTETHVAAAMQHPNIVSLIEADADGRWIALELVKGVNLWELLRSQPGNRLSPALATLIAAELCKAFVYMHDQRRQGELLVIVHRDVSPSNVLISFAGAIKLADFGLAAVVKAMREPQSTAGKGKFPYMAPEQATTAPVDGRSDLFSLGVLFYEMLAGRRPVVGLNEPEVCARLAAGDHQPLLEVAPHVPAGLAAIVECLLQPDPDRRFYSARACLRALSEVMKRELFLDLDLCFELGSLATAARRNVTLDPEALLAQYRETQKATAASVSVATLPIAPALPQTLPRRARYGRPSRRIALAVAVAILCVGAVQALGPRSERQPREERHGTSATAPASTSPTASATERPRLANAMYVSADPAASSSPPPRIDALVETTSRDARQANPEALAAQKSAAPAGHMTIGAIPSARVWVDGRDLGWSPVEVKVAPGRHAVAIGSDRPGTTRWIVIRGGEKRDVLF